MLSTWIAKTDSGSSLKTTLPCACSGPPDPEPPSPTPQPSPPGPPAPSPACKTAEGKFCPGLQGGGEKCGSCVMKNNHAFESAGCWGAHARHAFITAWCGPDDPSPAEAGVVVTAEEKGKPPLTADESSTVIRNCSFFGADGHFMTYRGTNGTFENNLWCECLFLLSLYSY